MKQRLKGLLALVLSLVMVFALATNAWAAVRVGGVNMGDGSAPTYYKNGDTTTASGSALDYNAMLWMDGGKLTLTLNNFTMVDNSHYEAISSDQDLTLNLIGDNEITASYGSGAVAVSVTGKLAIEGTGSLTADGTDSGLSASSGVDISGGKVTAEGYVYGIYSHNTTTITDGEVEATGRDSGIYANSVTITGGTVTAGSATDDGSGNVSYNSSFGIKAESSISVTGGKVTATGVDAIAIDEHNPTGTVTIAGATTTVTANGENSGIYAEGSVTISSGKVTATAAENDSCGIYGGNTITIGGANTKVDVGCETGLQADIVNIAGGIVTINSTKDAISNSATLNLGTGSRWYKWTDDKNATTMNDSDFTLSAYNGDSPAYLKFEPITYTVKFNANGGSGTMSDVTGVSGNYTLPENGFNAPVGDEFFGWSVDPDGAERKRPGETMQITRDTTVYAIWKYATLGNQGGGYPGNPQPYPPYIYNPTPTPEPDKVTSSNTFDGGIASAVVVTILSATGGAWLAKKKD